LLAKPGAQTPFWADHVTQSLEHLESKQNFAFRGGLFAVTVTVVKVTARNRVVRKDIAEELEENSLQIIEKLCGRIGKENSLQ